MLVNRVTFALYLLKILALLFVGALNGKVSKKSLIRAKVDFEMAIFKKVPNLRLLFNLLKSIEKCLPYIR